MRWLRSKSSQAEKPDIPSAHKTSLLQSDMPKRNAKKRREAMAKGKAQAHSQILTFFSILGEERKFYS